MPADVPVLVGSLECMTVIITKCTARQGLHSHNLLAANKVNCCSLSPASCLVAKSESAASGLANIN